MIKVCCSLVFLSPLLLLGQEKAYFQEKIDFSISVSLDTAYKTLDGSITINYTNNSPDTLRYLWFHLWPNAYKNDQTAFSEQLLQSGRTDFYFSNEDKRGYINKLNFTVNNQTAALEDHPKYIDVARLILPQPLTPSETIRIETPFHVQLPYLFSRSGYHGNFFSVAQWYPRPAVYDRRGWHPMPYLEYGGFYNDFGDYSVSITLPAGYTLAATGERFNTTENGDMKTVSFKQKNISDFVWFAGADLKVDSTIMQSVDGHSIKLFSYYQTDHAAAWKNSLEYIREIIGQREKATGAYPYSVFTLAEVPGFTPERVEYPTIASVPPVEDNGMLTDIISDVADHNWFRSVIGGNERDFPWMGRGMNQFYTNQYLKEKQVDSSAKTKNNFFTERKPRDKAKFKFRQAVAEKKDQPVNLPSDDLSADNYLLNIYYKMPVWLEHLKDFMGEKAFLQAMQSYYEEWKFRHPYPEDFKKVIDKYSPRNTDSVFNLLGIKGEPEFPAKKEFKLQSFYDFRETGKYNYIFLSPSAGFNYYDGLMAGGFIHNYTLPEPALHFFAAPMYGLKSKKFTFLGRAGYTKTSYGPIRKVDFAIGAAKFDIREFTDSTGKRNFLDFFKIAPSLRLTFRSKSPLRQTNTYLQWKTYFFRETSLSFSIDTIKDITIITYPKSDRYLNELLFVHENSRILYPFSYTAKAQQSDGFIKLTLDMKEYFNFSNGSGLNARIFGGKIFYTNAEPRYLFRRYQFNMTGPNGEEDYTYSNYFIGRNRFDGIWSQQIMRGDGAFKVRTDLLNNKAGTSDDWIAALNLDTDIPAAFNPLRIIRGMSLKAFADIGTYSGAWKENSQTGKFLFDAGLQVGIGDLINIYVPLLYSKVYRDYYKSTLPEGKRFWNTISFSIDIQNFRMKKFLDLLN